MTTRRRARTALLAVFVALGVLATSCGLPVDDGVRRSGTVSPDVAERRGGFLELPPAPQPKANPATIVSGFLDAQISGEKRHEVSRKYLLPNTAWDDSAGVTVYAGRRTEKLVEGNPSVPGPLTYQVSFKTVGAIGPDGAATVRPPVERSVTFRLVRDGGGEWRIDGLPAGLLLSTDTRDTAFRPFDVFFLPVGAAGPHLVADRQLLPFGSGAEDLVRRVLAPPSAGLADSGTTAAPPGLGLVAPVHVDASGAATVDLGAPAAGLVPSVRDALAAQLVWTLRQVPNLLTLRLLVEGQPLLADGQPLNVGKAYPGADPQGKQRVATAVVDGRLRVVGDGLLPASVAQATSVLDLAVDPRSERVALLAGPADDVTLRVGGFDGPLGTVAKGPGLLSPTWGDGTYGVWMLRTGPNPAVLVSRGGGKPQRVDFPGLPKLDSTATLRVSRDGARVLLVSQGQLLVARVVPSPTGQLPQLKDVRQLRPVGTVAADWLNATTLAVLISELRPLLLVSVDGVTQETVNQPLQESRAQSVAASGELPLLVGAVAEATAAASPRPSAGSPSGRPSGDPSGPPAPDPTPTVTAPETRLFSGLLNQAFELKLKDALRPRYPG